MADQSDVENALVTLAAAALYPNGLTSASVLGTDCRIYRGWPTSAALDDDLAANVTNVTVFPTAEPGRNTTRYIQQPWGSPASASLTASVTATAVTFSGTAGTGQLVGVLVDGVSYVYQTQAGDTPETVAAKLAVSVRSNWIVNLSGATFTVQGAASVLARVVAEAAVTSELRRQEQGFRITCWCPTPAARDMAAATIDGSMASFQFIALADGSQGRIRYRGSLTFDQSQDALLYRRDLIYDVEYPTTATAMLPAMLFGRLVLNTDTITA